MQRAAAPWTGASPATIACVAVAVVVLIATGVAYHHDDGSEHVARLVDKLGGRNDVMLRRFRAAETQIQRQRDFGRHELFTVTNCPKGYELGKRDNFAKQKAPYYAGNLCEPWMARFAIVMLDRLLNPSMRALEWGSGASSQWLLMRVGHLTSIEHDEVWVPMVKKALGKMYGEDFLATHWESHTVPRGEPVKAGARSTQDPESFGEYVAADFLPGQNGAFDYIAVDGRARVNSLRRAIPLLKAEGGILLLDNSNRKRYEEAFELVPAHWPRFDDVIEPTSERTTIWISCRKGACGGGSSSSKDHSTATRPAQ